MMYVEDNILIEFVYMFSDMLTVFGDMLGKLMIVLKFLLKFASVI